MILSALVSVQAHAADLSKTKHSTYLTAADLSDHQVMQIVQSFNYGYLNSYVSPGTASQVFTIPTNNYNFSRSVIYLRPVNDGKPNNRRINGILHEQLKVRLLENQPKL